MGTGCSPSPYWAVGTAKDAEAPSGPQPELLAPRYSPELLNIIKIQLLLLTSTVQQRGSTELGGKPTPWPCFAVGQELCSGLTCSLKTPGAVPPACC